jgi:phospholipid-translocating ATPase
MLKGFEGSNFKE